MWNFIKLWGAALIFGAIASNIATTQSPANAVFLVAFVLALFVGYNDRSIKELWRRKQDRRPIDWEDDDA